MNIKNKKESRLMLQTTSLNQCKWRGKNQINRKKKKRIKKKPKLSNHHVIWLTTQYTLSDVCVIVVFWYWILMSSNTPQNLETPILGSKIKRFNYRLARFQPQNGLWRHCSEKKRKKTKQKGRTSWRETCALLCKRSPKVKKKHERQRGLAS